MNSFRENIGSLLESGEAITFSDLQIKYEINFRNSGIDQFCTLENLRKLGNVPTFCMSHSL